MTEEELILWSIIKNKKLGCKFRRQFGIGNYIVDFYCVEKKLVIELDGSQHLDSKGYDIHRESYMNSLGIKTLRFWNGEIRRNLNGVIMKIKEELER